MNRIILRRTRRLIPLLGLVHATCMSAADYRHPVVAIPYALNRPTIDGVVDDAEWAGAMSHRALQTTSKQISARQTRFWMSWDEEHLYVAMRDPLRPGERPIQARRGRGRDLETIYDDCYEIWVSVGATDPMTGQLDCMTQFVANFSGARWDVLHQPAVGNSRTSSYDTHWEPKSRINDRNEWEMEVVIPRASLGTTPSPFHDGQRFRCLIARNYKRPWEQNSFEGTSTFAVPDSHSEFVMSKATPALHLLGVGDAAAGKLGLHLAAQGQTDARLRWRYASEAVVKDGEVLVKKGVLADVVNLPDLDVPGPGKSRVTVTAADGTTLLDWSALRAFGPIPKEVIQDTGDRLDLRVTLNPERDYVRIFGDLIHYDNREAIQEIDVIIRDAQGRELKRTTTLIDGDAYARDVIAFDSLPVGEYKVRLECKDKDGKRIVAQDSTFAKKDLAKEYAWWQTPRGNIEKVIAPWTPVTLKNDAFGVWGREMVVGPAGLPRQVRTQGHEILAAPGRLIARTADGKELMATGDKSKVLFDQAHRKTVRVESTLGDVDVRSDVMVEFDGLYEVTLTLTPRQATALKSLQIVLPYAETMADYIHAVTAEIRSGFHYGFTPKGTGRVWDCTQLGDKSMKIGSFIPYLWLGSPQGGLCWFADSDAGWTPDDQTPAIEIRRDRAGQVDLVFNLIGSDVVLDQPRTITFGLQGSPVKAMHKGWREDNWWTGDTFKDYGGSGSLIWTAIPFPKPGTEEKCRAMVEEQHKAGKPAVPYFIHQSLPSSLVPEIVALGEQWKTTVCDALCYRGSLIDFMVHHYGTWAETHGIDGYYIDNMRPILCDNIEHGCGYRLPDGRIQPTFQMFDTRRYFLRLRAAFLEQRPATRIVLHMTNAMILPWVAAADIAYDGEHHVIYPEMKKDFMDFWSLERLRVDYPGQWGVAVNFMQEYQGRPWDPAVEHNAFRSYFASVMLHDALPTGNANGHERFLVEIRKKFGLGDDNVAFLPYWDKTGIASDTRDVRLGGWLKPDKLLLLVANFGEKQDATVLLDPTKLGWGNVALAVVDTERGYKRTGYETFAKTEQELTDERAARAVKEAARIERLEKQHANAVAAAERAGKPAPAKPDLTPAPFKEVPTRREVVEHWSGDTAAPPVLNGTTLTVPVERHNYRLLVVEKR